MDSYLHSHSCRLFPTISLVKSHEKCDVSEESLLCPRENCISQTFRLELVKKPKFQGILLKFSST